MKKLYLTLTFAVVLMFVAAQNTHASPKCGWVGAACAHRGDVSNTPENTIPAFTSAVNNGAAQIELDVHLSSDNHMVIIHDSTSHQQISMVTYRFELMSVWENTQVNCYCIH